MKMSFLSTSLVTFAFFADSSQGRLLESRFILPLVTNRVAVNNIVDTAQADHIRRLTEKAKLATNSMSNLQKIKAFFNQSLQRLHKN
uniref:RxLR effector protein n=1 Tax=Glossina morsitans morsitans TaxID=37546 RepID=A0A905AWJ5_GLOMM